MTSPQECYLRKLLLWILCALALGITSIPARAYDEAALISVARAAVRAEVLGQSPPKISTQTPARPVFVTIEKNGKVAGCRGDLEIRAGSLEAEIVLAARAAARHDPRYLPLAPADLQQFEVTVTIIESSEVLRDLATLSPADGLVLKSGNRTGIVLPFEGREPRVRLGWAYKKAGVVAGAPCALFRLRAARFRG